MFIRDVKTFDDSKRLIEKSFLINTLLPCQVFQSAFTWFAFDDFDWAMSGESWPVIQDLCNTSGDTSLLMAVLDPDPEKYYKKEFGYYNWVNVPSSISRSDYWGLINEHPECSEADSVLVNSETVVWLPQSANWAIWGERSYGLCVLGCSEPIQTDRWCSLEFALENIIPFNFRDSIIPGEFSESLRSNYERR